MWDRSYPQEAGSECPSLFPKRNVTQKLAWACSPLPGRAGPKGNSGQQVRSKVNFLSEPHRVGLESGVRGAGAVGGRVLTLAPSLCRCGAGWPWDTASTLPPALPSPSPQATPRRLRMAGSEPPGQLGLWPQLLLCHSLLHRFPRK